MDRIFHLSSVLNRDSIRQHGFDWDRMGAAPGIAGSRRPEAAGCFLMHEWEIEWFLMLNNTGGPLDVWRVDGVDQDLLEPSPNGYWYLPERIPASQLTLVRSDVPKQPRPGEKL